MMEYSDTKADKPGYIGRNFLLRNKKKIAMGHDGV
jgi:hypothetical protein